MLWIWWLIGFGSRFERGRDLTARLEVGSYTAGVAGGKCPTAMAMATTGAATGGLAILVDEKRVNELLQQKSGIKALLRSAFNTILFVCFLLLFTSLALSEPRYKMRAFEGFLRKRFDEAAPVRIGEVHSVDSFWRYFNESFKPAIYGEDTARYFFPGAVVPTWLQVLGPNYLYGMGRMRSLNIVADSECRVASQYQNYFPTCYGPFNLDAVDREPFGPPMMKAFQPTSFPQKRLAKTMKDGLGFTRQEAIWKCLPQTIPKHTPSS